MMGRFREAEQRQGVFSKADGHRRENKCVRGRHWEESSLTGGDGICRELEEVKLNINSETKLGKAPQSRW